VDTPERNFRLVLVVFPGSDALLSSNHHSSAGSAWLLNIAQEERRRLGFIVTSQSRQFVLPVACRVSEVERGGDFDFASHPKNPKKFASDRPGFNSCNPHSLSQ
jgi:hypothetical protein